MTNIFENYLKESGLNKYFKGDESQQLRLYHDLNIYGDDAEDYLVLLRDKYHVDVSRFQFDDYFPAEFPGDSRFEAFLISVVPFLRTRYNSKKQFKPFTFSAIKKALEKGILE